MIIPCSVSLTLPEMGCAEAGSQLRGMVFLDEAALAEEGVEHSGDVPVPSASNTPRVSGKFTFYDGPFVS